MLTGCAGKIDDEHFFLFTRASAASGDTYLDMAYTALARDSALERHIEITGGRALPLRWADRYLRKRKTFRRQSELPPRMTPTKEESHRRQRATSPASHDVGFMTRPGLYSSSDDSAERKRCHAPGVRRAGMTNY